MNPPSHAIVVLKTATISLLISLALTGVCVAIIGVNLGGAFTIILFAMLVSPIAGSSYANLREGWIALLAAGAGASMAAIGLLSHDAFSSSQVISIVLTAFASSLAAGSLVRLLMLVGVWPVFASAIAIVISLAWLGWPVWLSPWLSSDVLASRLVGVHPLLAVNTIAPQFGYWIQQPLMYRLTSLGQDVMFTLPTGVAGCVVLHLAIAAIGSLSLIPGRLARSGQPR